MSDTSDAMTWQADHSYRQLEPRWNQAMIAASIAVSFLGAFTSTQLMCHARGSKRFSSIFMWTMLGSLIFGFCSIWCLHEVAMLACEFDLRIDVDVPLTIVSAILAVGFTFVALSADLLWDRYFAARRKKSRRAKKNRMKAMRTEMREESSMATKIDAQSSKPLLQVNDSSDDDEEDSGESSNTALQQLTSHESSTQDEEATVGDDVRSSSSLLPPYPPSTTPDRKDIATRPIRPVPIMRTSSARTYQEMLNQQQSQDVRNARDDDAETVTTETTDALTRTSSGYLTPRRGSSNSGSMGLSSALDIAYKKGSSTTVNAFVATGKQLYNGTTLRNIAKSFVWSLAITSMHYVGIFGLKVPHGYIALSPAIVVVSAVISWIVCFVGCILMSEMETNLSQQVLFSAVATAGVAAMHFTGMRAATFRSSAPPSDIRGYPPALATAVVLIAFTTCIAANALLSHSATISRNKLAEVIWTRRELWRTIAQKENAEAAAIARSEFIASASHEIRTPLHHLQGYSDLLSQTQLTEEGRSHLKAIQQATKTLSLITNNVLDWSKLEKDAKAVCKPVALDMRTVAESIITLLPNKDDEADVELYVEVAPDVPASVYLDETYIHRILMNLVSNALKFTRSGFILLSIEMDNDKLVATVEDTGCGLDQAFMVHMWEPYKQGEVRGSQRGTGLGLSIIKQLLHAMNGVIDVTSKYAFEDGGSAEGSGSTFTVSIPLQSTMSRPVKDPTVAQSQIAILSSQESRALDGLRKSWEKFGYDVLIARSTSELPKTGLKYVWVDVPFLKQNIAEFHQLLQGIWLVIVPYDTQSSLAELPGILSARQFVLLPKPLIWHSFEKRITAASRQAKNTALSRSLRFAPEVEIMDSQADGSVAVEATALKTALTILLVEDNPINQRLGKKMLASLGHEVLTAMDGQEAIEQIIKYDGSVDAILMDQSMPRKDGLTATKEIRELEAVGTLSKRRPIIAVTAVVNPQAQALFKAAGADDFLAKPLSLDKLRNTLAAHLTHG